jgi:hypothetical protein
MAPFNIPYTYLSCGFIWTPYQTLEGVATGVVCCLLSRRCWQDHAGMRRGGAQESCIRNPAGVVQAQRLGKAHRCVEELELICMRLQRQYSQEERCFPSAPPGRNDLDARPGIRKNLALSKSIRPLDCPLLLTIFSFDIFHFQILRHTYLLASYLSTFTFSLPLRNLLPRHAYS